MTKIEDQPTPKANQYPAVWDLVLTDIKERDALGQSRYGMRLQPFNGRDGLVDLYQELLDAVVYVRQVIYEQEALKQSTSPIPQPTLDDTKIESGIALSSTGMGTKDNEYGSGISYDEIVEIVEVRTQVKIKYQHPTARDFVLSQIHLQQDSFGSDKNYGAYEVRSLCHHIIDDNDNDDKDEVEDEDNEEKNPNPELKKLFDEHKAQLQDMCNRVNRYIEPALKSYPKLARHDANHATHTLCELSMIKDTANLDIDIDVDTALRIWAAIETARIDGWPQWLIQWPKIP